MPRQDPIDTGLIPMADVAITASTVKASTTGLQNKHNGISGGAFDAGDTVHQDAAGKFQKGDVNGVAPANSIKGIALSSCAGVDQPFFYAAEDSDFIPGGTVTEGVVYVASATPGKICPIGDLTAGDTVNYIGTGKASNHLDLFVRATGITKP